MTIDINTRSLEIAIFDFAALVKKDVRDIVNQQAGMFVGNVIDITPPGSRSGSSSGGIGNEAKKRGESSMEADIRKLFPTTKMNEVKVQKLIDSKFNWKRGNETKRIVTQTAWSVDDLRRIHLAARNPNTGRTKVSGGGNMAITRKALLNQYVKEAKAKVGELNAGWLKGAYALKTSTRSTPAWITRHGDRNGSIDFLNRPDFIGVTIFNTNAYFPLDMESRIMSTIARRENALKKASDAILARRAQQASDRMRV